MPGKIVEIKTMIVKGSPMVGQTKNGDKPINGKVMVYTIVGNFLIKPENLNLIGFYD